MRKRQFDHYSNNTVCCSIEPVGHRTSLSVNVCRSLTPDKFARLKLKIREHEKAQRMQRNPAMSPSELLRVE